MPRPAKGARIWFNKADGVWYIRDGSIKRSTGCGAGKREGAEEALSAYIAEKYEPPSDNRPDRLFVSDILTYYSREVAPKHRSMAASYAVEALLSWWSPKLLSDVKQSSCRAYVAFRTSRPIAQAKSVEAKKRMVSIETARRELAVLRAAINAYHEETPLKALPIVTLPDAAVPRSRWLSRKEAATLIRAARNLPDKEGARALVRFILIGLYTGTRSGAIRQIGWMPNTIGGYVDMRTQTLHRKPEGERETKKRKPSIRIPDRLYHMLARWKAADMSADTPMVYLIHYRGQRVEKQRKTWAAACLAAGFGKEVTPHILRHTAVTWMMISGETSYDVGAYVGMSATMIDEVYGHHSPDHQKGIASRIGRK